MTSSLPSIVIRDTSIYNHIITLYFEPDIFPKVKEDIAKLESDNVKVHYEPNVYSNIPIEPYIVITNTSIIIKKEGITTPYNHTSITIGNNSIPFTITTPEFTYYNGSAFDYVNKLVSNGLYHTKMTSVGIST